VTKNSLVNLNYKNKFSKLTNTFEKKAKIIKFISSDSRSCSYC